MGSSMRAPIPMSPLRPPEVVASMVVCAGLKSQELAFTKPQSVKNAPRRRGMMGKVSSAVP